MVENRNLQGHAITIVSHNLGSGGAAVACKRLQYALHKQGYKPQMILIKTANRNQRLKIRGILKKLRAGALSRLDSLICSFLVGESAHWNSSGILGQISARKILQSNPSAVNIHWIGHATISLRQIDRLRVPLIITAHDEWWLNSVSHYSENKEILRSSRFKSYILDFVKRRKIKVLSSPNVGVICLSTEMLEKFVQSYPFLEDRVKLIPNPVDESKYFPNRIQDSKKSGKTVVYLGGFEDKRKGFDLLLAALKFCSAEFKLLAPGFEGETKTGIRNQVTILSIPQIRNEVEMNQLYSEADLTVVPSRQEALPQVATESMMSGTPVVSFQVGGLKDIVREGITGVTTKNFSVEGLALNIDRCVVSDLKKSLQPRKFALENFSSSVVVSKYMSFINSLVINAKEIE